MGLGERIKELIAEQGVAFNEKARTIYTTCPLCDGSDKFSILKDNGSCICYRGSCDFGKRWFADWLALTARISISEAKNLIYNPDKITVDPTTDINLQMNDNFTPKTEEDILKDLTPIKFPEDHMIRIESPYADDGHRYVESRGIPVEVAMKYGIKFTPMYRRVIFPVTMNGKVYGYQGRAIDKVPDSEKMRNNEGFKRDTMVMFVDHLKNSQHVILCEGPVDAMKFDKVGGAVATLGKVISDKQKQLIFKYKVQKVYLALDEDAFQEMNALLEDIRLPIFKLTVPQSCRNRCALLGKKADFGECTFDECVEAFKNAEPIDENYLFVYFKE